MSKVYGLHLALMHEVKKYGNIYAMYAGRRYTIVLSNYDLIVEALIRQSAAFSGREEFYVEKYVCNPKLQGIIPKQFGDGFKKNKSVCHAALKEFGYGNHIEIEKRMHMEVRRTFDMFSMFGETAFCPAIPLRAATLSIMHGLMFNELYDTTNPTQNRFILNMEHLFDEEDPIFDVFPLLAQTPTNRKRMQHAKNMQDEIAEYIYDRIRECKESDTENFVKSFIRLMGKGYDESELMYIIRDLIAAGFETSSTLLQWAMVFMANDLKMQKRLQDEIDANVPRERLASLSDKSNLRYLEASIIELFRITGVVPLTAQHMTLAPSKVAGYDIPADAQVLVNIYAAHRNPEDWPEPDVFRPERFLDERMTIVNKERVIPFSFGKRSCFGELLARQEVYLFLAAILQNYDILPPLGVDKVVHTWKVIRVITPTDYNIRLIPRGDIV